MRTPLHKVSVPTEQINGHGVGNAAVMPTYNDARPILHRILTSDIANPGWGNANLGEHTVAIRLPVSGRVGAWIPSYNQVASTNRTSPNPWATNIDPYASASGGTGL